MNNIEIRKAIFEARVKYHEVARAIGISESTLSRWLRKEITGERKEQILEAIKTLA